MSVNVNNRFPYAVLESYKTGESVIMYNTGAADGWLPFEARLGSEEGRFRELKRSKGVESSQLRGGMLFR